MPAWMAASTCLRRSGASQMARKNARVPATAAVFGFRPDLPLTPAMRPREKKKPATTSAQIGAGSIEKAKRRPSDPMPGLWKSQAPRSTGNPSYNTYSLARDGPHAFRGVPSRFARPVSPSHVQQVRDRSLVTRCPWGWSYPPGSRRLPGSRIPAPLLSGRGILVLSEAADTGVGC